MRPRGKRIISETIRRDPRSGGVLKILAIGCAGVVVLAAGVAVYVGLHARQWAGDAARAVLVAGIEESALAGPQKVALAQAVDQLTEDFKAKQIGIETLVAIGDGVGESPIFDLARLRALESGAILDAALETAQMQAASLEFQRYYRAVVEGTINRGELDRLVSSYVDDVDPARPDRIGADVSDAERDQLIDALRSRADAAGVAAEPYEIDFVEIFNDVVARARGGGG